MDDGSIADARFCITDTDAMIAVQNLNIFVAEIVGISVDETIVTVFYRIVFNAVAVCNIDLHAVVCNEKVTATLHDLVGGIIKQIIPVETQNGMRSKIIFKIFLAEINGGCKVKAIITEIEKNHPFFSKGITEPVSE